MAQHVRMPRLSQDMTEGRILAWLKKEGEAVRQGEPLLSVESDKAEVEVQAPATGLLRKVLVQAGMAAGVGTPLAILGAAEEDIQALLVVRPAQPVAVPPTGVATSTGTVAPPSVPAGGSTKRQPISPAARRVARELGIDASRVTGSGPGGMVTEADVRAVASQVPAPSAVPDDVEVIPLSAIRLRAAERVALSRRTAADVTTVVDVDMTEVAGRRQASGASYTAYVTWATAQALREFPILNATLDGERILVKKRIDLGVAVALEHGLVVPVIRGADGKSVDEIARELDGLAKRARAGTLGPGDLSGSTFTVTNSGAFGSLIFTPIINQPEAAILGMGKVADTPVVRDGQIVARKIMYLCLSYDHRIVDGAPAVQFLQAVKRRLEHP